MSDIEQREFVSPRSRVFTVGKEEQSYHGLRYRVFCNSKEVGSLYDSNIYSKGRWSANIGKVRMSGPREDLGPGGKNASMWYDIGPHGTLAEVMEVFMRRVDYILDWRANRGP